MMRVMNELRVEYRKGKKLDLELLLTASSSPLKKRPRKMSPYKQPSRFRFARTSTRIRKDRTRVARSQIKIQGPSVQNLSMIRDSLNIF